MSSCISCGKPAKQRCSGCKSVYFCNKECQKASWPSHKGECSSLKKREGGKGGEEKEKSEVKRGFFNTGTSNLYEESETSREEEMDSTTREYRSMLRDLTNEIASLQGRPGVRYDT